ncbi:flagellar filament capping protein FliD [Metabacillus litoralis]|uniref:flagellar filament capping protein FliD n=1 Tax=Metabacillus litoralis TaxID=152268 RepID=UPI0013CE7D66|nr:flagellar filament capping protein FliD [Metabacillus litoralis]
MAMRIGGLASGMDIDSLVGDLMKAERMPLDKLNQKKQTMEWQRDGYREMNSLMLSFRNLTFDMRLSSNYRARSTSSSNDSKVTATATSAAALSSYNISKIQKLATAATRVNEGAISKSGTKIDPTKSLHEIKDNFADSNFSWKPGSVQSETLVASEENQKVFKLKNLNREEGVQVITADSSVYVNGKAFKVKTDTNLTSSTLASNEVLVDSDGNITFSDLATITKGSSIKVEYAADKTVDKFAAATTLESVQLTKSPVLLNGSMTLTIGDVKYTYDTTNNNFVDTNGNVADAQIDSKGKITFQNGSADGKEVKVNYQQEYFTFDLGTYKSQDRLEQKFIIQGSESLNSVLNKISSSNLGLTAFYDEYSDQVTLTRKETGNHNEAGLEIDTGSNADGPIPGFINNVLRFGNSVESGGDNAEFTINGLTTQRTTNTFEMNGVTFTLKDTLNPSVNGVEPTTLDPSISVNISNDSNKVFENIKNFVEKYNELIDKIKSKVNEERYRDFTPLTDEQREQLSDKQQEQWEEKAKSGLLRRDSLLTNVLSSMRLDFYTPVNGTNVDSKYNQLSSIGIKTSANYLDGGKLQINEAELKKAIEEDPAAIEALFKNSGSSNSEQGIVNRLYETLTDTMDAIKSKAGSSNSSYSQYTLGKNLNNLSTQINRFEDRLVQVESRYWRQFTAMEKAIQRSNEQSMYLMQQFSM